MKIIHIINNLGSGGAEKLVKELVNRDGTNNEYYVYLLSKKNNRYVNELKNSSKILISKRRFKYSLLHIKDINKLFNEIKPDVVHAHLFPSFYYVSMARKKSDAKFLVTEHGLHNNRNKYLIISFFEKYIYNNYDKIIAVSESVKNHLINKFPRISNKIKVIHNGIEVDSNEARENILKEPVIFTIIARLIPEKNHIFAIKALSSLKIEWRLNIVGEGPNKVNISKYISKNELENKIEFMGFLKDITTVLKKTDIFLLPSLSEGFGLSALEAMSIGVLTLVSNIDGLREIVPKEFRFNPRDTEDLVSKIESVLFSKNHDELSKQLKKVANRYSIQNTINNYLITYNNS